jgi:hypothetical protein
MTASVVRIRPGTAAAALLGTATAIFALSLLMNGDHLGANAAIHWDARTMVCAEDPMPDKSTLLNARDHVFDAAMGATDPGAATYYFNHNPNPASHRPLETVRRYYTQVSTVLARGLYVIGARWTGSPTGGILFFQIGAGIAVALSLAIVATLGIAAGPASWLNWKSGSLLAIFLLAVAGEPVVLSLSRQMLTEPAGFVFLAAAWGTVGWFYRPTTSTIGRLILSALGAGFFFLTIRTRYNLAATAAAVTPLVVALFAAPADVRRRWMSYVGGFVVSGITLAGLIAVDVHEYGRFILPTQYQRLMVKSTWLFFHTRPPFDPFWTAVYVNGPLLVLPVLVVGGTSVAWLPDYLRRGGRSHMFDRRGAVFACAAIALVFLSCLLAKTGAQQVGLQPRHLFPFSAGFVAVALLVFPWTRWRWFTAVPFAASCLLVTGANIFSTTGPQRTTMAEEFPPVFTAILHRRVNAQNPPPLWRDLLAGYYDWADNRRLHDSLVVLRFAREHPSPNGHKSLLIVDDATEGAWWIRQTAVESQQPTGSWRGDLTGVQAATGARIKAALAAGDSVYLACPKGPVSKGFAFHTRATAAGLDVTGLWQVVP